MKPTLIPHRRPRGFTLVETVITLAVAAILVTIAVPSMRDFVARNRMTTELNTLVASMYLARSEAVKRLQNVKVCPANTTFTGCTGRNAWESGWMVFVDVNNDDTVTNGTDVVLQQNPALPDTNRFKITGDPSRPKAVFSPNGQAANSNNTISFCDADGVVSPKNVVLSPEGRVRTDPQPAVTNC